MKTVSKDFKNFSIVYTLFHVAYMLAGIFINLFLLRETGDVALTMRYNIVFFIAEGLAFTLGVFVCVRLGVAFSLRSSFILYLISYALLLALNSNAVNFYPLFAVLIGTSNALYWSSYYPFFVAFTNKEMRYTLIALLGVYNNAASIGAPIIGSIITSVFAGFTGYITIFIIIFCLYAAAAAFSFRINLPKENRPFYFKKEFVNILKCKKLLNYFFCIFFRGFKEGAFIFLPQIILFTYTQNEQFLSITTLAKNIVGMSIFYWARKKVNNRNCAILYIVGMIFETLFLIAIFPFYGVETVFLIIVVDTVVYVISSIENLNVMHEFTQISSEKIKSYSYESSIFQHYAINIGRIIPIIIGLALNIKYELLFLLCSFGGVFAGLLIIKTNKVVKRAKQK